MNLRRGFFIGIILALFLNLVFLPSAGADETVFDWPVKSEVAIHYLAKYSNIETGKNYTHHGIDIQAPAGTEVVAAGEGKVSFAGFTPAGGDTISVIHPNGYKTTYLQLTQMSVSKGEEVKKGQAIAAIAASGDKSFGGPHLHFGVKEIATGKYVDPEILLPPVSVDTSSSEAEASESLEVASESSVAPDSLVTDSPLAEESISNPVPGSSVAENYLATDGSLVTQSSQASSMRRSSSETSRSSDLDLADSPQQGQELLDLYDYQLQYPLVGNYPGLNKSEFLFQPLDFSKHNGNLNPLPGKEALEISLALMAFLLIVVLAAIIVKRALTLVQRTAYSVQRTAYGVMCGRG